MLVNCDIGERGANHPVDVKLMDYIQVANIACGGHAGDKESVDFYLTLAESKGVKPSAHLSYPDRENFGRTSMKVGKKELQKSLDEQYELIPNVKAVKFHGALYNDANVNMELAETLTEWLVANYIEEIITPDDSLVAKLSRENSIKVIPEAFAERRYIHNTELDQLELVPRSKSYASIKDCNSAVEQSLSIIKDGMVDIYTEDSAGNLTTKLFPITAETICIHSDAEISLELAERLSKA